MTLMTAWDMSFGMEKEEEEEEVTEELEEEEECCLNLKDTIVVEETVYEGELFLKLSPSREDHESASELLT